MYHVQNVVLLVYLYIQDLFKEKYTVTALEIVISYNQDFILKQMEWSILSYLVLRFFARNLRGESDILLTNLLTLMKLLRKMNVKELFRRNASHISHFERKHRFTIERRNLSVADSASLTANFKITRASGTFVFIWRTRLFLFRQNTKLSHNYHPQSGQSEKLEYM